LVTLEEAATASGGVGGSSGAGGNGGISGAGASGAGGAGAVSGAGAGGAGAGATGGTGGGGKGGDGGNGGIAGSGCVPAPEVCNGADDDCDDAVDEDTDAACFPAGTNGCVVGAGGSIECKGACVPGMQRCEGGVLSECTGFVGPVQEVCGAAEAADEDCDGTVDNGCACDAGETQACYSGRRGSAGNGPCRAGTQSCVGGSFGACVGEVTPADETCANPGVDDNCDRVRDNVPMRNGICFDFSKVGNCLTGVFMCQGSSLVCVTPSPVDEACNGFDDDCDGPVDEDFAFSRDEDNCGGCGTRCAAGDQCCGGTCRAVGSDEAHCGECNNTCGGLTCCGGDCVATDSDANCGGCNIACGANEDCCNSVCTRIDTADHCGSCGMSCSENQECCAGECSNVDSNGQCGGCNINCMPGQNCCDGMCVMMGNTNEHCGACGIVCPESCPCSMGECRDSSGLACL
jgi:hypothetical protein